MRSAREWVLDQPGGDDFSPVELDHAIATIEARDREVRDHTRAVMLGWFAVILLLVVIALVCAQ